jgi:hypothetical protein
MRRGRVGVREGGRELRRLGSPAPGGRGGSLVDGSGKRAEDGMVVEQQRGGQEDERVRDVS